MCVFVGVCVYASVSACLHITWNSSIFSNCKETGEKKKGGGG